MTFACSFTFVPPTVIALDAELLLMLEAAFTEMGVRSVPANRRQSSPRNVFLLIFFFFTRTIVRTTENRSRVLQRKIGVSSPVLAAVFVFVFLVVFVFAAAVFTTFFAVRVTVWLFPASRVMAAGFILPFTTESPEGRRNSG